MTLRLASPSDVHGKIFAFLAGEFARKGEYQCTKLELLRGRGTAFNDEIRTWNRTEKPERFEIRRLDEAGKEVENPTVREFALELMSIAEGEVAGSGGKHHRFTLRSTQVYGGRQTCGFHITTNEESGGDDTELVKGGESVLIMRGFSDMLKVTKDMYQSTTGGLMTIADKQVDRLNKLYDENDAMRRKIQDLENDKTEREWRIYQEQVADNRSKQSMDRLFQLGSVAVASFSQGKLGAGAAGSANDGSPVVMMLREFFASITPDQEKSLRSMGPITLSMGQLMMLNTISQLVAIPPDAPPPNAGAPNTSPSGIPSNGAAH